MLPGLESTSSVDIVLYGIYYHQFRGNVLYVLEYVLERRLA